MIPLLHKETGITMSEKSIVREAKDIRLAMELITLGARLQMLESENAIKSRGV